jgi:polysaccharide biosynthesis/export protein
MVHDRPEPIVPLGRSARSLTWACLSLLLLVTGCAGPKLRPIEIATFPVEKSRTPLANVSSYVLQLGDEIEVKFYYQSDLNEYQAIRPDGKISLQLIGDLNAAGLTSETLAAQITSRYRRILRRPEASVIVKKIVKAKIFVGGRVQSPKILEIDSTLTTLQAIFQAGGFLDSAEMRKVLLVRRDNNYSQPVVYQLDLEEPNNDILLHPYDIVYVPPSSISDMNSFVEQYITKLVPFNLGMTYQINTVR